MTTTAETVTVDADNLLDGVDADNLLDGVDAPAWAGEANVEAPMFENLPPYDDEVRERFRIADNGQADWAMRKLCKLAEQSREVDELVARQLEPIERWRDAQHQVLNRERLFWEALLTEFHRALIEEDPKATSVKLPHGTLKSRKLPDRWDFDDESFLAWARDVAPELVRTKEEVDKALAKKALSPVGDGTVVLELPEGNTPVPAGAVSVTVGDRKFDVEVTK